ncbi:MAG: hypothetical protein ABI143_06125, partial [Caldimonas sp.]
SLVMPLDMARVRSVSDWSGRGVVLRLHIGLEDTSDLIADLAQALALLSLSKPLAPERQP